MVYDDGIPDPPQDERFRQRPPRFHLFSLSENCDTRSYANSARVENPMQLRGDTLQHEYSARGVHRNATSGRSFYVMVRDT